MVFSKAHPKGGFAGPGATPDVPQDHAGSPQEPPEAPKSPGKWVPKSCSPLKKAMAVALAAAALAAVSCRL